MAIRGMTALLDDIAAIADDVATLTYLAAKKSSGVVTDDLAVTAEQTLGLQREREWPVVRAVAWGSLKNKWAYLAPGALLLNYVAPWAITPILMAGGVFLSFEGVEKLAHKVLPHDAHADEHPALHLSPEEFERTRVQGAIRTDFILSAEVVALTLAEVTNEPLHIQAAVLYALSAVMTVAVYGLVAILIKLDDVGEALVLRGGPTEPVGKMILAGTPWLMKGISWVGTVAMLLVGGHILIQGIPPVYAFVHDIVHSIPGFRGHLVGMGLDLVMGLVAGSLVLGVMKTGVPARLWAARPWAKTAPEAG